MPRNLSRFFYDELTAHDERVVRQCMERRDEERRSIDQFYRERDSQRELYQYRTSAASVRSDAAYRAELRRIADRAKIETEACARGAVTRNAYIATRNAVTTQRARAFFDNYMRHGRPSTKK